MKKKYLLFFGQNYYFKIDTTEISIFNFSRTLIIVSINYDIYKENVYDNIYDNISKHMIFIGFFSFFNFDFSFNWYTAECFDSVRPKFRSDSLIFAST